MKNIVIPFLFLLMTMTTTSLFAHTGDKYHVIFDTDCGIDDFRVLNYLFQDPRFEILAITTNDGALGAQEGLEKIKKLLHQTGHEGIPIAAGRNVLTEAPPWREMTQKLPWGEKKAAEQLYNEYPDAPILIRHILETEEEPVIYLALGPLTNLADAIGEQDELIKHIKDSTIYWYNPGDAPEKGIYFKDDYKSSMAILNNNHLQILGIHNGDIEGFAFDLPLLNKIDKIQSPAARLISQAHHTPEVLPKVESAHLKLWDDLVYSFLIYPEHFTCEANTKWPQLKNCQPDSTEKAIYIHALLLNNLDNKIQTNVVFNRFPEKDGLFQPDVEKIKKKIISRHGFEEWKFGVLTNEIHNHLGIYSIIGIKMGIRARHYFDVGPDEVDIVSYAGKKPPFSCMNDGLQVSTGATTGRGSLEVIDSNPALARATFTFKERTLQITLKEETLAFVKEKIQASKDSQLGYWESVRKNGLEIWEELDKMQIFNLKIIEP